jgi:hypothetical protein
MTCTIDRNRFKTELGKQVFDRLVKIKADDNFIYGILCEIMGDEKKKEFLNYLDKTKETDPDVIEDYINSHYEEE